MFTYDIIPDKGAGNALLSHFIPMEAIRLWFAS
jgi:hypothetical protein